MALECTNWRAGPRTSQIPVSGWRHVASRWASTSSASQGSCDPFRPAIRIASRAASTSAKTSGGGMAVAALPIRTGCAPS